jgi:hypothetical protein
LTEAESDFNVAHHQYRKNRLGGSFNSLKR